LQGLSNALKDTKIARWLPHITPLSSQIVDLVSESSLRPYLTPQLVNEINLAAAREADPDFRDCARDRRFSSLFNRLMSFHAQVAAGVVAPRVFRSSGELKACVQSFADREQRTASASIGAFPAPPFSGTPEIVPITSPESLITEGRQMRNCSGAEMHLDMVRKGLAYFFRVYAPKRCTLMVEPQHGEDKNHGWKITELRTFDNGVPGLFALQTVTDALGIPAAPVWIRGECWWAEQRDFACVPRKAKSDANLISAA
jgi:hypothetical protein